MGEGGGRYHVLNLLFSDPVTMCYGKVFQCFEIRLCWKTRDLVQRKTSIAEKTFDKSRRTNTVVENLRLRVFVLHMFKKDNQKIKIYQHKRI